MVFLFIIRHVNMQLSSPLISAQELEILICRTVPSYYLVRTKCLLVIALPLGAISQSIESIGSMHGSLKKAVFFNHLEFLWGNFLTIPLIMSFSVSIY